MALLKDVFAKKGVEPMPAGQKLGTPTEQVITMRGQGLTNNQIIEALQRQGYAIDEINNAINQADIKEGVLTPTRGGIMPESPEMQMGQGMPPPEMMGPMPGPMMQQQMPAEAVGERIQEIAEAIIDEKWSELITHVNKIVEWKETTESRITKLEQQVKDLRDSFDKLHEGVLGRISEYDKGIQDVGTEIKALEKVFQKVLPGFIENVGELSRITDKMKAASRPPIKR